MNWYRTWEPLLAAERLIHGPALVVAPHPDDEIAGCGGMIIAHRRAGVPVDVVVMTDGARGNPTGAGGPDYTALRKEEVRRCAAIVGGFEAHFLEHPDGALKERLEAAEDLARIFHQVAPATVFLPSPYEVHPDHRAACLLGMRALRRVSPGPRIYLYEVGAMMPANLLVDVTPYMVQKEKAMEVYFSQLMHQDMVGKIRAINRGRTINVDDPAVRYAEAYIRVEPERADTFLEAVENTLKVTDGMSPTP